MTPLPNAHPLEWAFLATAITSFALSVSTLRDALVDSAYLVATRNQQREVDFGYIVRKTVADMNVRQELFRLSTSLIMVLVSTLALFMEPPPPDYTSLPQSQIFLFGWITVCILKGVWSLMDKSTRRKLARYLEAPNPTDPATGSATDPTRPTSEEPGDAGDRRHNGGDRRASERHNHDR